MDYSALAAMHPCARCRVPTIVLQCLDIFSFKALLNSGGTDSQTCFLWTRPAERSSTSVSTRNRYSTSVQPRASQWWSIAAGSRSTSGKSRSSTKQKLGTVSQKPGDEGSDVFVEVEGARVETISLRAILQGLACCKAVEEVVSMGMSSKARLSTELQAANAAGRIRGRHT